MEARSQLRHRPVQEELYVLRIPHWLYHDRCAGRPPKKSFVIGIMTIDYSS